MEIKEAFEILGNSNLPASIRLEDTNDLKYRLMKEFDIDFMEGAAAAIGIRSEEDAKSAVSMALQSRKIERGLEEARQKIVRPHIDYQKAVNELVKAFKDKLFQIEENLRLKTEKWMLEQSSNPFTSIDGIEVEDGSMKLSETWDFEVMNPDRVPTEFLMIDEKSIKDAVKNGIRNIPGVKIFKFSKSSLRIKN
jgi:hypothetical protein